MDGSSWIAATFIVGNLSTRQTVVVDEMPAANRRSLVLGHRGCGVGPGENTVESLREALRRGADGVELDVRRTADGVLVVHHDPVVEGRGPISELRSSDLPAHVPALQAVFEALCPGSFVDVEIKNSPHEPGFDPEEHTALEVVDFLEALQERHPGVRLPSCVVVSSFSLSTVDAVASRGGTVPAGLLTLPGSDQREALALAIDHGCSAVHPFVGSVDELVVDAAHRAGMAVNVWPVDDPAEAVKLARLGVDALITNDLAGVIGSLLSAGVRPAG
jgi:glycerophosphoryl diester phosphodiesterase